MTTKRNITPETNESRKKLATDGHNQNEKGIEVKLEDLFKLPKSKIPHGLDNLDLRFLSNRTPNSYFINQIVGEGSFATVYHAIRSSDNNEVAIKVYKSDKKNTKLHTIDRLEKLITHMMIIPHLNIIGFYEFVRHPFLDRLYLVSEYTEESDLYELLNVTNTCGQLTWLVLDEYQARHIIKGMANGLNYLHRNGISHGDLKLNNVLIFWSNQTKIDEKEKSIYDIVIQETYERTIFNWIPKLADFDSSRMRSAEDPCDKIMECRPRCTLQYASPESFDTKQYDLIIADSYSLGCCLLALVSGSVPFDGGLGIDWPDNDDPYFTLKVRKFEHLCNLLKKDISYVRQLFGDLSQDLKRVLENLLQPISSRRLSVELFLADQWFKKSRVYEEVYKHVPYEKFSHILPKDY